MPYMLQISDPIWGQSYIDKICIWVNVLFAIFEWDVWEMLVIERFNSVSLYLVNTGQPQGIAPTIY
jgi:hypothetical protein